MGYATNMHNECIFVFQYYFKQNSQKVIILVMLLHFVFREFYSL